MLHANRSGVAARKCANFEPCVFRRGAGDARGGVYATGRLAVVEEGLSYREAARRFGIGRCTVGKILSHSARPGYRRTKADRRSKLEGFTGIVDAML